MNSFYRTAIGMAILFTMAGQVGSFLGDMQLADMITLTSRLKTVLGFVVTN